MLWSAISGAQDERTTAFRQREDTGGNTRFALGGTGRTDRVRGDHSGGGLPGRLTPLTLLGAAGFALALVLFTRWLWRIGLRRYSGASS